MDKQLLLNNYKKLIAPYSTKNMEKDIDNAANAFDILDVFIEYLPSDTVLTIVNKELDSCEPHIKEKLELVKKIAQGSNTFNFTIPEMQPLPDQKLMTRDEAEKLAQKSAGTWLNKGGKQELSDLADIFLLCNNFEVTNTEKKLIKEFKGKDNVASWFNYTGPNLWPSVKVILQHPVTPYFFVNMSLRMSYFDKGDKAITLRLLQFDGINDLSSITDLRHLEHIMRKQKLIPKIDPKDYIAQSDEWYDYENPIKLQPETIWPFFAENMQYIDKGICVYNKTGANPVMYADYCLRILSYFPEIPERYYYRVWDFLLYGSNNKIAYECFLILKRYPDLEEKLIEYSKSDSESINKRTRIWLDELHNDPQPIAKRYFLSKNGNEYWNISQTFTECTSESGEIESRYPKCKTTSSMSIGQCREVIDELIKEQKAKGFKETDEHGVEKEIQKRNEKALQVILKKWEEGNSLISPPTPFQLKLDELDSEILDPDGKAYTCVVDEGILTNTDDLQYMKASLQCLINYVANTKFDSTVDTLKIGKLTKGKFTPLTFKKNKYSISFDVLCEEAYKHAELRPWLLVLLQTITAANKVDEPIWADEQTMLGMQLACLLGQERQYAQLFMDYFHSIQSVDNHTHFTGELNSVDLPLETHMQLLAGFYANSICSGDLEDDAIRQVRKFKKEQAFMFMVYLGIECKYLIDVEKRYQNSIAGSVESYFEDFHKGKDAKILAKLFVEYIANTEIKRESPLINNATLADKPTKESPIPQAVQTEKGEVNGNNTATSKNITLYFRSGSSDKVYHAELLPSADNAGYLVNVAWGRRGSTMQTSCKTAKPLALEKAQTIYDKLVAEKMAKGYSPGEDGALFVDTDNAGRVSGLLPQLLNIIEEEALQSLIDNPDYCAQPKHDGERRMIKESQTGVNRKGLTVALPEHLVETFAANIKGSADLDGEMEGDVYTTFDILSLNGNSLREKPYSERLSMLKEHVTPTPSFAIIETAFTAAEKRALYERLKINNNEGIVFKLLSAPYTHGRPNSGGAQLKFKFCASATVYVLSQNENRRSVKMGVNDQNGKCREIGSVTIPVNHNIPDEGQIIEVRYLYAYPQGSLYQPIYVGPRPDMDIADCDISQLKYKAE